MKDVERPLEKRRKSLGLTVRDVEDRSGLSSATIYRIESGNSKVKEDKRGRYLRVLAGEEASQASGRFGGDGAEGVAELIAHHAKALLKLAESLRGQNGQGPAVPHPESPSAPLPKRS